MRSDTPISAVSITNPHTIAPQAGAHISSFIVRRMAFFNSTPAKSGWYHIMRPTTFRCSSFRDQVACPLPAYPVSTHAPDFVAVFVHIRGILAVIRPLVWYPTKARNIDLIAGLQLYGRLRCGRRRLRLRRFDRRHRLCRCGYRNGAKLLVRLCLRRFRIFPFCRCHSICFRGSCGVRWYWGGSFLPCVWLRPHSGTQGQAVPSRFMRKIVCRLRQT